MDASSAVSSRLIGSIFVEKGLITQEQLDEALRLQAETGERLGEIVVGEFGVSRLELASVLAEQWAEFERGGQQDEPGPARHATIQEAADQLPVEPQLRRPIGEIFVERGFVTADQLEAALEVQRRTGQRLGEVLVAQGSLSRLDLASALAEQWSSLQKIRPPEPAEAPQPWQNGTPTPAPAPELATGMQAAVEELGARIGTLERATMATPWRDELGATVEELRAAIAGLEQRLADTAGGTDEGALVAISAELEQLRARTEEPLRRVAELDARVSQLAVRTDGLHSVEELRGQLERFAKHAEADTFRMDELRAQMADLATRPATGPSSAPGRLEELADRVDALAGRLAADGEGLEQLRARVAELSQGTGVQPQELHELHELRARVDQLADRPAVAPQALEDLQSRLAELAGRPVLAPEQLDEVWRRLQEVERHATEAPPELAGKLDELRARVDQLADRPAVAPQALEDLQSRLAELAGRPVLAPEQLDEVWRRLQEVERHATDAAAVPVAEIVERLETVAGQAEAAQTGLASLASRLDELGALAARVDELALHLPGEAVVEEMRQGLAELAARTSDAGTEKGRLAELAPLVARLDRVAARVEELAGRVDVDPTAGLRDTVDGVRAALEGLRGRVDELAEPKHDNRYEVLSERVARLETHAGDGAEALRSLNALAGSVEERRQRLDARLAELAAGLPDSSETAELRARVDELARGVVAMRDTAELEQRLLAVESQLADTSALDALRDEIRGVTAATAAERDSLEQALAGRIAEITGAATPAVAEIEGLRERVEELAARPVEDESLHTRLDGLAARLDEVTAAAAAVGELRSQVDELSSTRVGESLAVGARLAGVERALEHLGAAEERLRGSLAADVAARVDEVRATVDESARRLEALTALEHRVAELGEAVHGQDDGPSLDDVTTGLRAEISRIEGDLRAGLEHVRGEALREVAAETSGIFVRLDALEERAADGAGEERLQESIAEQAASLRGELGQIREAAAERERALDARLAGLASAAAVDELRGKIEQHEHRLEDTTERDELRAGLQALSAELHARVNGLEQGAAEDRGAAAAGAASLTRLEESVNALRAELDELRGAASGQDEWRAALEAGLQARIGELAELRKDDAELARSNDAELVARIDDVAVRAAQDVAQAESAFRQSLDGLAARAAEREAAGAEADEALRAELERVASSVGWRLERIEESLSADDHDDLRAALDEVRRRLDEQTATTEEQVRVTERALRKGLAALGSRLAETESAYAEAGGALRRSIERLGAAITETDIRIAERASEESLEERIVEATAFVAFAPFEEGYRLVELEGSAPVVGGQVEVDGYEGPLVVTRVGQSPLPLDPRPCAYLQRP